MGVRYYGANRVGGGYSNAHLMVKVGNIVRTLRSIAKQPWRMESIPKVQGALVSLDPEMVLCAAAGGFHLITANLIVLSKAIANQGSIIRPLFLLQHLSLIDIRQDSLIPDAAIRAGKWQTKNADGRWPLVKIGHYAAVHLLYHAIPSGHSPAGVQAGVDESRHPMDAMGGLEIERMPSTLALALGAANATPLQMATRFYYHH